MRKIALLVLMLAAGLFINAGSAHAEDYVIDTKNSHAFIQFKIPHLGYSWLLGRFNSFEGSFTYDEKALEASSARVEIETASIDTNNAKRDKHLRSEDFLDAGKFPKATFVSTSFEPTGEMTATMKGNLTMHGVTRPVEIEVTQVGAGDDPWGGFRRGFEGTTRLTLADYNINFDLGPASKEVELYLSVEGIRQ